jgi:hypothetical protein
MISRPLIRQPDAGNSRAARITATRLRNPSTIDHLRDMQRCGRRTGQRKGLLMRYRLTVRGFTTAPATALGLSKAARASLAPGGVRLSAGSPRRAGRPDR